MKRYLVFGFDQYYPAGGMNDFIEAFDKEEEIDEYFIQKRKEKGNHFSSCDHYHVLDIHTGHQWNYCLPK